MSLRDFVHFWVFETTRYIAPMPVAVEWVLVIPGVVVIAFAPIRGLEPLRGVFIRLARRTKLAIVICGLLPVMARLALLGIMPVPNPSIHDDFGHLLLGDTLAHGRLSNRPHALWQHFESIHILQQPTYASMYLPGQGSFLALGEVLFHEPWAGVAISVGLMFAALCWAMQGWLPPAWAFYGTLIAILKIGVTGAWMNSYLGGPVPAIGGALLIGCVPRLRAMRFSILYGLLFGAGVAILMNTRPYEGGLLTLAILIYLGWEFSSMAPDARSQMIRRVALPGATVVACGAAFLGYYCRQVTGSPFRIPYQVNRATYGWPENLAFLPVRKLTLRHKVLQDMNQRSLQNREAYSSWDHAVDNLNTRVFDNWIFFAGPALTIALLFVPAIYRDRSTRMLVVFLGIMLGLNLFQWVLFPYHFAPSVPMFLTILAAGMRHTYVWLFRRNPVRALRFAAVLPVVVMMVAAMKGAAETLDIPLSYWERAAEGHRDARAALLQWLRRQPGKQLVIVRYAPRHQPDQEWVYNGADIDGSKVVWAREMTPAADAELIRYFHDREIWLLQADVWPTRVVLYPKAGGDPGCVPVKAEE